MTKVKRRSYPTAEDPSYCIEILELIKESLFPKVLALKLTRKHRNKFPVIYNIMLQNHLTSAYFELLEMLGLCKICEKTDKWYVFEFSELLKKIGDFPEDQIESEILGTRKEFNIKEKIEAYGVSKEASRLLDLRKNDKMEFLLSYFHRFFRLEPPYFRFGIQHPRIGEISTVSKKDFQTHLFLMIKEKFPTFTRDDTARILGWSEYFRILRKGRINGDEKYFFSITALVQYIGHSLTFHLNEKCEQVTHHNWQDLESDLYQNIFFRESLIRLESFLEIILDQNPGQYRWGIIERGPDRYEGFKGNPGWQLLHIKRIPLHYQYQPHHVPRVVKS